MSQKARVYYYHNVNPDEVGRRWKAGELPAHLLYGALHLPDHGFKVVLHKTYLTSKRWRLSINTLWKVVRSYRKFDIVYATTFRGLELVVLLRAIHLFQKPIVCWHHQPIVKAKSPLREAMARVFYHGFDELLFFSQKIINDSLRSVKAPRGHMHVVDWGADLEFYDRLIAAEGLRSERGGFVSTGKERRDMPTLVTAFNQTTLPLDIYICRETNGFSYERQLDGLEKKPNVRVHYISGDVMRAMAVNVYKSLCAVICCQETNYTVGLTTLVEAMALGIPVICSRNPQMPVDIDGEGMGLTVDYGDVNGWVEAIKFMGYHPDKAVQMGRNGRKVAETKLNEKICASEVADIINNVLKRKPQKKLPKT